MSSSDDTRTGPGAPDAGMTGFHAIAAARGDGLHPLLAQALAKTGSVSGPPAPSLQSDDNVLRIDFGEAGQTGRKTIAG